MKILYDHQIFTLQNFGGISRYFCELLDQFSSDPFMQYTLAIRYSTNIHLRSAGFGKKIWFTQPRYRKFDPLYNFLQKHLRTRIFNSLLQNQNRSIFLLKKQDYDIFHPTYYESYFLKYIQKKPFVLTVYDMIYELFPKSFSTSDVNAVFVHKKNLIEASSSIIAISQNTKRDLMKIYDVDPDKIHVIYLGNSLIRDAKEQNTSVGQSPFGKYLLYVGNRGGYKNFHFLLQSLVPFFRDNPEISLVSCGGGSFTPIERKQFQDLKISDRLFHMPANDQTLQYFYQNALAFVFPSLYEGFGIPVLEAFSCGCPVLLSSASSLPEVGGDAAIYFNPTDAQSIISAVEILNTDETKRDELIKKGYCQLEKFSWAKTAMMTKKIYNQIIEG